MCVQVKTHPRENDFVKASSSATGFQEFVTIILIQDPATRIEIQPNVTLWGLAEVFPPTMLLVALLAKCAQQVV